MPQKGKKEKTLILSEDHSSLREEDKVLYEPQLREVEEEMRTT
jgi:hypothetical protein